MTIPATNEGREASQRTTAGDLRRLALLGLAADDGGVTASDAHDHLSRLDLTIAAGAVADIIGDLSRNRLVAATSPGGDRYRITPDGEATRQAGLEQACALLGLPNPSRLADERERLEQLRTDLLSTVSHELRTPLTLIRTSVGLLLDSTPDETMRLRLLRNIKQSTDRMHVLVNDMLDLVRLRHGQAELVVRAIDPGALVEAAVALIRPLVDEKGQELVVAVPAPSPVFAGDARRLERVLLNLLSNANIFSPPGATITVRAQGVGEEVRITVADTGPGIPDEARTHLFEQFYTARTSSSSRGIGVGLGLPIAMGIVEAHGGRIDVESEVGRGSSFHVTLPKDRLDAQDGYETAGR